MTPLDRTLHLLFALLCFAFLQKWLVNRCRLNDGIRRLLGYKPHQYRAGIEWNIWKTIKDLTLISHVNQSGERNLCNRQMLEWDILASTEVGHVLQTWGYKKYPPLPEGTNSKTPMIRFKVNYWLLRDQIICPVGYRTFQMNALWDFERQWVGLV